MAVQIPYKMRNDRIPESGNAVPKSRNIERVDAAIADVERAIGDVRTELRKKYTRPDDDGGDTASSESSIRCAIKKLLSLLSELVDDETTGKETNDMDLPIQAKLSMTLGHVIGGNAEQPALLKLLPVRNLLPDVECRIQEINTEIRNRVPILGNQRNPYPLTSLDEESLIELGYVLALRTHEAVQLVTIDREMAAVSR